PRSLPPGTLFRPRFAIARTSRSPMGWRFGWKPRRWSPGFPRFRSPRERDWTLAMALRDQEGQASLEFLAAIPALFLAGLVALQLLATGYTLTLADGAAEAGAMALAAGKPAGPAVRDALPGWARGRSRVDVNGGRLT